MELGGIRRVARRGLSRGERAVGWTESPAAAGGVDEDAYVGAAHALSDALADGGGPVLGVAEVVETSQAVRQQTQVSCSKSKRHLRFQLQAPAGLLLGAGRRFLMVVKGPSKSLDRRPQQKSNESHGSRDEK